MLYEYKQFALRHSKIYAKWITNIEDSDQKQESPSTYINVFSHTLTTCYNSFEYQIFYDIITQCVQCHMFIAPISQP